MTRRSRAAIAVVALLVAACSGGADAEDAAPASDPASTAPAREAPASPSSTTTPPPPPVIDESGYAWAPVDIEGGGFVTGVVTAPTGEVYVRTDVGGAYALDRATGSWRQMLRLDDVEDATPDDYLVESIAVAADGQIVYLAAGQVGEGRILATDDGGRTWRAGGASFRIRGNDVAKTGGERLAVDPADPAVVYYGSRSQGLWRSTDAAASWERVGGLASPTGATGLAGVTVVAVDAASPVTDGRTGRVLAASSGRGVFESLDAGATWERVVPLGRDEVVTTLDIGADGTAWIVVGRPGSRVIRLDPDGTATDVTPRSGRDYKLVVVDPADAERVMVTERGVRDGALWRSTDAGGSWDALDVAIDVPEGHWAGQVGVDAWLSTGGLAHDPIDPERLWFAEGVGVWSTTDLDDDEVTWSWAGRGIEELVSTDAVVTGDGTLVTAHWDRSVFVHADGEPAAPSLTPRFQSAWDLATTPADPAFVAAVVDDHRDCCGDDGLATLSGWSDDGGRTWNRFGSLTSGEHPEELRFGNIAVSSSDVDHLVWQPSNGGRIHHSDDRGQSWQVSRLEGRPAHEQHFLDRRVLVADPVDGDTFYVLSLTGLFRSVDGGATWDRVDESGLPPRWARRYDATMAAVPGRAGELILSVGFVDGGDFALFRSTDGGRTWSELGGPRPVGTFGLGADTERGVPVLYATGPGESELWRSDDLGVTWEHLTDAPAGLYDRIVVVTPDPIDPDRVVVGFNGTGFLAGERPDAEAAVDG